MKHFNVYFSPIGSLFLVEEDGNLISISYEGIEQRDTIPFFEPIFAYLDQYFDGKIIDSFSFPVLLKGTSFQKEVWEELLNIPYGSTISYGEIAKRIGNKRKKKISGQAVGQALKRNPLVILYPCHRVIGKKGELTGYRGGLKRKEYLLTLEKKAQANISSSFLF